MVALALALTRARAVNRWVWCPKGWLSITNPEAPRRHANPNPNPNPNPKPISNPNTNPALTQTLTVTLN